MSNIKYTEEGQEVVVVREVEGGYLVNHVYDYRDFGSDDDYFETYDHLVFYEKIYDKAPTFKLAQEIIDLEKQKEAIEEKIGELKELANETRKIAQEVEKYPILQVLKDYLTQDFTHIVYMRDLRVSTNNTFSWSNSITVTNVGLDELHIVKHSSQYRSGHDPAIMIFKSEDQAKQWIRKKAIRMIKSQVSFQYNNAECMVRMWNEIHYESPAKTDPEVREIYHNALDNVKIQEKEAKKIKAEKELRAAAERLHKLENL